MGAAFVELVYHSMMCSQHWQPGTLTCTFVHKVCSSQDRRGWESEGEWQEMGRRFILWGQNTEGLYIKLRGIFPCCLLDHQWLMLKLVLYNYIIYWKWGKILQGLKNGHLSLLGVLLLFFFTFDINEKMCWVWNRPFTNLFRKQILNVI